MLYLKGAIRRKLSYLANYLRMYRTYFHRIFRIGRSVGMINLLFVLVLNGRCHGNRLIFGLNRKNWSTHYPFIALSLRNGLEIAMPMCMLTAALSRLHLVKFGELASSNTGVYEAGMCTAG